MTAHRWEKMPDHLYHQRTELSSSLLRRFMQSPLQYLTSLQFTERTDALDFGGAVHLAILQPDEFGNGVIAAPKCDRRTKEGKAVWAAFTEGLTPDTIVLDQDEWTQCNAMADMVRSSEHFLKFVERSTHVEVAGFATVKGLNCRIKPDLMGNDFLLDYKTTTSCSIPAFERSVWKYGYAIQGAFYQLIAQQIDGGLRPFYLLAQEKKTPYDFRIFELDATLLAQARKEILETIERLNVAVAFNNFPGYSKEVVRIGLPRWFDGVAPLFGDVAEGEE